MGELKEPCNPAKATPLVSDHIVEMCRNVSEMCLLTGRNSLPKAKRSLEPALPFSFHHVVTAYFNFFLSK